MPSDSSSLVQVDANEAWLSGLQLDSLLRQKWKTDKLPPLRQKRFLHAAVKLNDWRVLVIGGKYDDQHLACTEIYDSRTDSWEDGPVLNQPRSGHAAVFNHNHNCVYCFGGYNNDDYLVSIECLHLSSSSSCKNTTMAKLKWKLCNATLSVKRSGCAAVSVGPLIYIMGGYESRSDWSSVDILDTTTGKVTKGPSMTTARSGCSAAVIGTTIYVVGGNDAHDNAPHTVETLTIGKTTTTTATAVSTAVTTAVTTTTMGPQWQLLGPKMFTARCFAAVTAVGHLLVVTGGHDGTNNVFLSSAIVLDTKRNVWWTLPNMCYSRYGCASVTLGSSRVVVIGGTMAEHDDVDHDDANANNSMESLHFLFREQEKEEKEESSSVSELKEKLGALQAQVSQMSEQMLTAERKRREEFQQIMSQLMQIQNALNPP